MEASKSSGAGEIPGGPTPRRVKVRCLHRAHADCGSFSQEKIPAEAQAARKRRSRNGLVLRNSPRAGAAGAGNGRPTQCECKTLKGSRTRGKRVISNGDNGLWMTAKPWSCEKQQEGRNEKEPQGLFPFPAYRGEDPGGPAESLKRDRPRVNAQGGNWSQVRRQERGRVSTGIR